MSNFRRPNFLCIGFPRSGTTWLDAVLTSHPQIQLPEKKKEIHYFNIYHHLGEEWYLKYFPVTKTNPVAVGEVSPLYVYSEVASRRIAEFGSIKKLIVMLRDPISHLVSAYQFYTRYYPGVADRAYFLRRYENAFFGLRLHFHLNEFMEPFDKEQFLFLTKDDLDASVSTVLGSLSKFLEVDERGFDTGIAAERHSWAQAPRFRFLYDRARGLRDRWAPHLEWSSLVEQRMSYMRQLFFRPHEAAPDWLLEELRLRKDRINVDTSRLAELIGRDLSSWEIK